MSTDQNQGVSELLTTAASDATEGGNDSASTSEATDSTSSADTEESKSQAEQEKQKQVQHHLALALADPKHLESLRDKGKGWIADLVAQKMPAQTETQAPSAADLEALLDKKLEERLEKERAKQESERAEDRFKQILKSVDSIKTTQAQREKLDKFFASFSKSEAKDVAFELALEAAGIDVSTQAQNRAKMSLPSMTTVNGRVDDITAKVMDQKNLDQETVRQIVLKKHSSYRGVKN